MTILEGFNMMPSTILRKKYEEKQSLKKEVMEYGEIKRALKIIKEIL